MTVPEGEVVHQTTLRLSSSADECYTLRNVANDGWPNIDGLESRHKLWEEKAKQGSHFWRRRSLRPNVANALVRALCWRVHDGWRAQN
jgi:hypothetical protein